MWLGGGGRFRCLPLRKALGHLGAKDLCLVGLGITRRMLHTRVIIYDPRVAREACSRNYRRLTSQGRDASRMIWMVDVSRIFQIPEIMSAERSGHTRALLPLLEVLPLPNFTITLSIHKHTSPCSARKQTNR